MKEIVVPENLTEGEQVLWLELNHPEYRPIPTGLEWENTPYGSVIVVKDCE